MIEASDKTAISATAHIRDKICNDIHDILEILLKMNIRGYIFKCTGYTTIHLRSVIS